jgi:hypothetical protein
MSLREVLANLVYKLRRLVEHVWAWLSSWSYGHIVAWCDVVLLCQPWRHCRHSGGSPAILYDMVFFIAPGFLRRHTGVGSRHWVVDRLVGLRS